MTEKKWVYLFNEVDQAEKIYGFVGWRTRSVRR